MLIKKSRLSFDLNFQDEDGKAAFNWACRWGKTANVNVIIDNAKSYRINLKIKVITHQLF